MIIIVNIGMTGLFCKSLNVDHYGLGKFSGLCQSFQSVVSRLAGLVRFLADTGDCYGTEVVSDLVHNSVIAPMETSITFQHLTQGLGTPVGVIRKLSPTAVSSESSELTCLAPV